MQANQQEIQVCHEILLDALAEILHTSCLVDGRLQRSCMLHQEQGRHVLSTYSLNNLTLSNLVIGFQLMRRISSRNIKRPQLNNCG